jgi:hypothetical protein
VLSDPIRDEEGASLSSCGGLDEEQVKKLMTNGSVLPGSQVLPIRKLFWVPEMPLQPGCVKMLLQVDEQGFVDDVKIIESSNQGLDHSAVKTAYSYIFTPPVNRLGCSVQYYWLACLEVQWKEIQRAP